MDKDEKRLWFVWQVALVEDASPPGVARLRKAQLLQIYHLAPGVINFDLPPHLCIRHTALDLRMDILFNQHYGE